MRNMFLGLVAGIVLSASVSAMAAGVFGNGYMMGWTVMVNGEEVCSDPFVYPASREIECD